MARNVRRGGPTIRGRGTGEGRRGCRADARESAGARPLGPVVDCAGVVVLPRGPEVLDKIGSGHGREGEDRPRQGQGPEGPAGLCRSSRQHRGRAHYTGALCGLSSRARKPQPSFHGSLSLRPQRVHRKSPNGYEGPMVRARLSSNRRGAPAPAGWRPTSRVTMTHWPGLTRRAIGISDPPAAPIRTPSNSPAFTAASATQTCPPSSSRVENCGRSGGRLSQRSPGVAAARRSSTASSFTGPFGIAPSPPRGHIRRTNTFPWPGGGGGGGVLWLGCAPATPKRIPANARPVDRRETVLRRPYRIMG